MLIVHGEGGQAAQKDRLVATGRGFPVWALTTSLALLAPTYLAGSPPESSLRPVARPTANTVEQAADLPVAGELAAPKPDPSGPSTQPGPSSTVAKAESVLDEASSVPVQPSAAAVVAAVDDTPRPLPVHDSAVSNGAGFGTTSQYILPYVEERDALLAALQAADPRAEAELWLDYAQFLIGHMMVAEAQSILENPPLDDLDLDPISRDRAIGYAAILSRLAGQQPAGPVPAIWRDDPLWSLFLSGPQESLDVGGAGVRSALTALSGQNRLVATAVLPVLFEHALLAGDVGGAAEILAAAPASTDLEGTPSLDLMRGRLALAQGAEEMAFDIFARVSDGQGEVAANARLALADMALSRGDSQLLPEVRDLLRGGLFNWRGDAVALRLRVQLARVAEEMNDVPTEIEVMTMIIREHPDTPEADLAHERLGMLLRLFASQIDSGDVPLEDAIAIVRRLDPPMVGRGDWITVRVSLAERLLGAGLLQAAQAEFVDIAALPASTLQQADAKVLDAAVHRQVGLMLAHGDSKGALAALDRRLVPESAELLIPAAGLRIAAKGADDVPAPFLAALGVTELAHIPDAAIQAGLARTAQENGDVATALAAYDQSIEVASLPERVDAARLAGEAKDKDRAERYINYLSGERGQRQGALVEKLVTEASIGGPLSVGSAETIIADAQATETAVTVLLGPED